MAVIFGANFAFAASSNAACRDTRARAVDVDGSVSNPRDASRPTVEPSDAFVVASTVKRVEFRIVDAAAFECRGRAPGEGEGEGVRRADDERDPSDAVPPARISSSASSSNVSARRSAENPSDVVSNLAPRGGLGVACAIAATPINAAPARTRAISRSCARGE